MVSCSSIITDQLLTFTALTKDSSNGRSQYFNAVEAVIESSNNAISIYEYPRYQYEGVIDENAISKTLGSLVTLHDKLENILNKILKINNARIIIFDTKMIENRREGFTIWSGVDLNSKIITK